MKVSIKPEIIEWAVKQSGEPEEKIEKNFPKLSQWMSQDALPTVKQLEAFAKMTHIPFGYLLLDKVPALHRVQVPDFRTIKNKSVDGYSRNLQDTIDMMKGRQEWLREYKENEDYVKVSFVGSATKSMSTKVFLRKMYEALCLTEGWQIELATKEETFNILRNHIEDAGVIVFVNGVVGSNTHRRLDLNEFRGFALADEYAPLIFINGVDSVAGRIFTLAHELVHIFLGQDGVDDSSERFCNAMTAAFLIPEEIFSKLWKENPHDFSHYEKTFKVSQPALFVAALKRGYNKNKLFSRNIRITPIKTNGVIFICQHFANIFLKKSPKANKIK